MQIEKVNGMELLGNHLNQMHGIETKLIKNN